MTHSFSSQICRNAKRHWRRTSQMHAQPHRLRCTCNSTRGTILSWWVQKDLVLSEDTINTKTYWARTLVQNAPFSEADAEGRGWNQVATKIPWTGTHRKQGTQRQQDSGKLVFSYLVSRKGGCCLGVRIVPQVCEACSLYFWCLLMNIDCLYCQLILSSLLS